LPECEAVKPGARDHGSSSAAQQENGFSAGQQTAYRLIVIVKFVHGISLCTMTLTLAGYVPLKVVVTSNKLKSALNNRQLLWSQSPLAKPILLCDTFCR
jgi:hypothetical protein